jgi:hypothetical protein
VFVRLQAGGRGVASGRRELGAAEVVSSNV